MSAKIRVYELASELGMTNKELLALLQKEGFTVRSHSSCLEGDDADLVRRTVFNERKQAQAAKNAPAPKSEPVKEEVVSDEDAELAALMAEDTFRTRSIQVSPETSPAGVM